jgi:hypothetical protein
MSYYRIIDGERYDRKLLEAAEAATAGRGDGRISLQDAQQLLDVARDGGLITSIERSTLAYIRSRFRWTAAAGEWFDDVLHDDGVSPDEILRRALRVKWALPGLVFRLDAEAYRRQLLQYGSKADLASVVDQVIACFLRDDSHDESFRTLVQHVEGLQPDGQYPGSSWEAAIEQAARRYLDASGEIDLLPDASDPEPAAQELPQPVNEETVAENWIFGLRVPSLSDHYYWCIIDRKGNAAPYNYGFN